MLRINEYLSLWLQALPGGTGSYPVGTSCNFSVLRIKWKNVNATRFLKAVLAPMNPAAEKVIVVLVMPTTATWMNYRDVFSAPKQKPPMTVPTESSGPDSIRAGRPRCQLIKTS